MIEQEAINRIINHRDIHRLKEQRAFYITEAFDMAIKALEKQIPIKPHKDNKVPNLDFCKCGTEVTNCDYCPMCGQKIDWE